MRYFRRFRMEFDLMAMDVPEAELPEGFVYIPWSEAILDRHASVKYQSFQAEIDSNVFRCLGEPMGCRRLMTEIAGQPTFLPLATWLVRYAPGDGAYSVDCGTIQGLAQRGQIGAVQNVGVIPSYRGYGLGRALMLKALAGFRDSGMRRVSLEVTADNHPAVNLYSTLGFQLTRTMYKAVETLPEAVC